MRNICFSFLIFMFLAGCNVTTTLDETDVIILSNMINYREKLLTDIVEQKLQKCNNCDTDNIKHSAESIDIEILNLWNIVEYSVDNNVGVDKHVLQKIFNKIDNDINKFKDLKG